jgi:hypothetical protein
MEDSRELLWRQYSMAIDLFKHYLKLAVELNVFFYAITGGVISYYFAHSAEKLIPYALLLPILMSIFFALFFLYGAYLMRYLRQEVFDIRDALQLKTAPDLQVLSFFLVVSALLMVVVAIGLGFVVYQRV